ncbi:FAS1-like dehydratase domain-containing protein [Actinomadura macra]|uniref:FAS1-like dehydratase domain-containing protein n=1 Tax=Actinomadura macra TaxID=46164 RepID=UPI00082CFC88|nr:MaoC family dehydratase N-terminal domain-containing protein [Actinomadura macra]
MVDWDAVYESARGHVGEVTRRRLGRVSATQFQRFAVAAGDSGARYFSDEQARAEGFPGAVAPPLFLSATSNWGAGPDEADLRPDGTGRDGLVAFLADGLRLVGGGQELEFLKPVVDGCEVTQEVVVEAVDLKNGRSGRFIVCTFLRRFLDEHGHELVRCRERYIGR